MGLDRVDRRFLFLWHPCRKLRTSTRRIGEALSRPSSIVNLKAYLDFVFSLARRIPRRTETVPQLSFWAKPKNLFFVSGRKDEMLRSAQHDNHEKSLGWPKGHRTYKGLVKKLRGKIG